MKKIILATVYCLLISLLVTSCKKETYTQHEPPVWQVDSEAGYHVNMTAVVTLSNDLIRGADSNDKLAAFDSHGECRGVGKLFDDRFHISIKGVPEDEVSIHFMYYSARSKYLYRTKNSYPFDDNKILGTVDNPVVLDLEILP